MMEKRDVNNDYLRVLSVLQVKLIDSRIDRVTSSVPQFHHINNVYSITDPAIKYGSKEMPLTIYDIEIYTPHIGDEIIQKWINHSSSCICYRLLVPEEIKANVESICVRVGMTNYEVIPYHIEKKGKDMVVIIEL